MGNQKSINCGASGLQIHLFFLLYKMLFASYRKNVGVRKSSQTISKENLMDIVDDHLLSKIFIMNS